MPTPLTPDEEFDAHFRRGLEHPSGLPEAPDTPDAWQRMEALLDAEPAPRPPRRRGQARGVAALLLLLLVAGLGWYYQRGLRQGATGPATPAPPTASALAARSVRQATPLQSAELNTGSLAVTAVGRPAPAQPATSDNFTGEELTASAASPAAAVPAGASALVAKVAVANTAEARATSSPGSQGNGQPLAVPTAAAAVWHEQVTPSGAAPLAHRGEGRAARVKRAAILSISSTSAKNTAYLANGQLPKAAGITADEHGVFHSSNNNSLRSAQTPRHRRHLVTGKAESIVGTPTKLVTAARLPLTTRRRTRRGGAAQLFTTDATDHPTASRPAAALAKTSPTLAQPAAAAGLPAQPRGEASGQPQAVALLAGTGLPGWRTDSLPALLPLARVTPFDSLPKPKELPVNNYRLRIGLLAAPELSAVHQRGTGVGGSAGIQIEYQLARRWRLSTGYLQAIKRYAAGGGDYRLLAAWPSSWTLIGVAANCRIVDVPLNLRYDVWQQPQRRAFVSGGLSSLFMRREDYTYQYEAYGKPYSSDWQFLNYSNHPFQVLNLSVGYEQSLSPRWALQVEPYLKLPLGGVGYGAVRLQSAGVFFALKYGLLRGPAAR